MNFIMEMLTRITAKKKQDNVEENHIINSKTPFAIREAYKTLFTNVRYLNIEDKCKKIVITSAFPGEGKTTLSCNLALTLSHNLEDKKILLIDSDMRRPRVCQNLGINTKSRGLSEYLAGLDEDPHFEYAPNENLVVLPAGGSNVNPTKLISSERMQKLLEACSNEFDYIIIDTPPVTVVADAVLYNTYVNGYILASRSEYSMVPRTKECIESLEQVGAEIYGIVLSDLRIGKIEGKYGKYRYSRYSKYGKYSRYSRYYRYSKYANYSRYDET